MALQELNLCFRYPIIFWNTANLIVDSGGTGAEEIEEEDGTVREYFGADNASDDDDEEEDGDKKKKKKTQTVNYGKISSAIGQMQAAGVKVSPPDINKSSFTFIPDVDNNAILYGIKGISRIGDELVTQIIKNRPYTSLQDFLSKVKVNVLQALNLIKSGAFDCFDQREVIMEQFIDSIADKKKTLNLRNMQMLIEKDLLPEELDFEKKVFNFNKYLRKSKNDEYGVYVLDDISERFYRENFDEDKLWYEEISNGRPALVVGQADWDKVYKKAMDKPRNYIKNHLDELLEKVNTAAVEEKVGKYCDGSISKWEMDSIGFYYHEHELAGVDNEAYDIVDFNSLPEEPEIDRIIHTKDGKDIPLYKLHRFAGTVVDKNKTKGTVSLLTEYGVVTVKIYNAQFAKYDKQISMKMDDGHKKILEKSWLSRGNKLLITGIRRGPCVVPKRYKNSIYQNVIELITGVNEDGSLETLTERMEVE